MAAVEIDQEMITLTIPRRVLVKALADLGRTNQISFDADIEILCDQIEGAL